MTPLERARTAGHQWGPGPDGPRYHCTVCGISKVDDHDAFDCLSWALRRAKDAENDARTSDQWARKAKADRDRLAAEVERMRAGIEEEVQDMEEFALKRYDEAREILQEFASKFRSLLTPTPEAPDGQ